MCPLQFNLIQITKTSSKASPGTHHQPICLPMAPTCYLPLVPCPPRCLVAGMGEGSGGDGGVSCHLRLSLSLITPQRCSPTLLPTNQRPGPQRFCKHLPGPPATLPLPQATAHPGQRLGRLARCQRLLQSGALWPYGLAPLASWMMRADKGLTIGKDSDRRFKMPGCKGLWHPHGALQPR